MGRLVRKFGNEIAIAYQYVAGPGYRVNVADYAGGGTPPAGWVYYADDVTHESFAPVWVQPTDASNAYAMGVIVERAGVRWRSLIDANVWVPGVSGWLDISSATPAWIQPTGAHDAYAKDALVKHNAKFWISLLAANVWEPPTNWRETALIAPDGTVAPPAWVQPTGAGDAYALDALVTHNGSTWKSLFAANVWEPGVFGWELQ